MKTLQKYILSVMISCFTIMQLAYPVAKTYQSPMGEIELPENCEMVTAPDGKITVSRIHQ